MSKKELFYWKASDTFKIAFNLSEFESITEMMCYPPCRSPTNRGLIFRIRSVLENVLLLWEDNVVANWVDRGMKGEMLLEFFWSRKLCWIVFRCFVPYFCFCLISSHITGILI